MTRITRRGRDKEPSRISAEADPPSLPAINSADAPKMLSTDQIDDDLTEMGVEDQGTDGDLHHADVFRALFYNSQASIDERLPTLSGEWAAPDYTDEQGLDILRNIHRRRQRATRVTPVPATELPANSRLAEYYQTGLLTPSTELEDSSDDDDTENPRGIGATSVRIDVDDDPGDLTTGMLRAAEDESISQAHPALVGHHESLSLNIGQSQPNSGHTGQAAGNRQIDPYRIFRRIDRGAYPHHREPAPDRLQYNDADRNLSSLAKAQGCVTTTFEGIGAHITIVPKSLLSEHERPATHRSSRDDSRTPILTEDDIDTYLADQEKAYARKSKELESEVERQTKNKWAALKRQAKKLAPPKTTPTVKEPGVQKNVRRSSRQRPAVASNQGFLTRSAILKKPSPLSQLMSATSDASVSQMDVQRPPTQPFGAISVAQLLSRDDPDDEDHFTSFGAKRERTQREKSPPTFPSPFSEQEETTKVAVEVTKLEELDSNSLQRMGSQPVHKAGDKKRKRRDSDIAPAKNDEGGSVSAPVDEPNSEEGVSVAKSWRSTHAASRKRDGSGRFQGKKKSVLIGADNAKVTKAKAKKGSK